ncbi:MAG: endonuclease/exonuclease/phosphatase family protein [Bacteroidales bacterium]|nr:endonuclease/exonuclease/phosphatase family protein [Bacteroidales bacterium]
MNRKLLPAVICLAMFLVSNGFGQSFKVMTYNIRVDIPVDTANNWDKRKDALNALLNYYAPDVLGVQEALHHQLQDIKNSLVTYNFVGRGRTDGGTQGEYSAIFFNTGRFEVIRDSTFWLSQTPEKPSRGWDAAYDRVCTYALLLDRTSGRFIWVFNTHLDNVGVEARLNGASLIMQRIRELLKQDDYPVLFMGDLNCVEVDEPVQYISGVLTDSKTYSMMKPYGPAGTFNGFEPNSKLDRRIDFIFTSREDFTVDKHITIDDRYGVKWPSDHLPVMVHLELK